MTFEVDAAGQGAPPTTMEGLGFVREVQVELRMNAATARALARWLVEKSGESEEMLKQIQAVNAARADEEEKS
jgi:hypothetical protein